MSEQPPTQTQDRYSVPGLERGLRLLSEFNRNEQVLAAPELAKRLGIPRTTTFRLLNTLESLGFVQRVEGGHTYRLGMAILRLGFEYLASLELTELSQPILERVRDETGLSCNLAMRDEHSAVIIGKVAAPTPFVSTVHIGTRLPLHATLLGRVLLSDMQLEDLRRLYPDNNLKRFSARTATTVEALYELILQDAKRGYGLDEGYFEPEVASAAVAVRNSQGTIIAVLGVTIPVGHLAKGNLNSQQLVDTVYNAATELSNLLGFQPSK
ncbi:IclR family transcriptional regulator [Paenalcaligenes niemegkensis]|uniref:IclR family transcriptional regulator n=1 Tax=Paenalcaligenes niemegkensis TaxID=2895469 RepID=UPI001EE976D7|nr:IclR family transcriptional regulator [Paenalcaligenes niemegkensis]MCQ9617568.1 IclR family transcriptional regulator [Paenalcaligenes niemegkensis]